MSILICLLSGVSVAGLCYLFLVYLDTRTIHNRLGFPGIKKIPHSLIINILMPLISSLAPHLKGLRLVRYRNYLKGAIVQAGLGKDLTVEEFWAFQIIIFFISIIAAMFFPVWFLWPIFGMAFPLQWMRQLVKSRKNKIVRMMPDVVDILMLSVEAGLDFMLAVGRVAKGTIQGALMDELKMVLDDIRLGATRSVALKNLAHRCDVHAVTSFVSLLVQADRLGSSIGPILRAHSYMMRSDRFQRAEQSGHVAAQKILFPLVFFIMPATFFIIFGPIIIRFMNGDLFTS